MITVLHGTDSDASYKRFSNLLTSYKDLRIIQLDKESSEDDLSQAFLSQDLFDNKKIIVIKNLIKKTKSILTLLDEAPKDLEVILWESDELTPGTVAKLAKVAKVENFKLPAKIFYLLDHIAPEQKKIIAELNNLGDENSLIWNIQYRLFLLTLAKLKVDVDLAGKISKRFLADWQWSKIRQQAEKFTLPQIRSIFHASLRIDYLIKSGQTNLSPSTLLTVMFLKYL